MYNFFFESTLRNRSIKQRDGYKIYNLFSKKHYYTFCFIDNFEHSLKNNVGKSIKRTELDISMMAFRLSREMLVVTYLSHFGINELLWL